jgi:hypothetical protein
MDWLLHDDSAVQIGGLPAEVPQNIHSKGEDLRCGSAVPGVLQARVAPTAHHSEPLGAVARPLYT